jgi:hypothetical protein
VKDELPRYRTTRDLRPPTFARVRFETPWVSSDSSDVHQYLEKPIAAGQIIENWTAWPHESWSGLNEPAKRILNFYRSALRSRLGISPYRNGELVLDDGVSGKAISHLPGPALPRPYGRKTAA